MAKSTENSRIKFQIMGQPTSRCYLLLPHRLKPIRLSSVWIAIALVKHTRLFFLYYVAITTSIFSNRVPEVTFQT